MAFRKLINRLAKSPSELDEEQLREFCHDRPGVSPITEVAPREPFTAVGEILSVRIVPRPHTVWLEVTISDGTEKMVATWTGRRRIAGITPGRRLVFSGCASATGPGGRLLVINPSYELL